MLRRFAYISRKAEKPYLRTQEYPIPYTGISHSNHLHWKKERNGKHGGIKQAYHKYTNWYHPFLWAYIDTAAKKYNWSAHRMVNALKQEQPTLFSHLNKGTVSK